MTGQILKADILVDTINGIGLDLHYAALLCADLELEEYEEESEVEEERSVVG